MSIKALITSIALGCSTLAGVGAASAAPARVELQRERVALREHRVERARFDRHWWQPRYARGGRFYGRGC